jgi:hypothetical protein
MSAKAESSSYNKIAQIARAIFASKMERPISGLLPNSLIFLYGMRFEMLW